jgi:hypothetical protein
MAGPLVNVLVHKRRETLVALLWAGEQLLLVVPYPEPQDKDKDSEPTEKLWAGPNLIQDLDKH